MPWRPPTRFFPPRYVGSTARDATRRYHYSTGIWLPAILRAGVLDPRRSTGPRTQGSEIVWASAHPVWEPTVNIGLETVDRHGIHPTASFQQTVEGGGGVCRFVLAAETVPYDFPTLCTMAGIPAPFARDLVRVGNKKGARATDWYGTFAPVAQAQWLAIEVWRTDHWRPLSPEERAAALEAPPAETVEMTLQAHQVAAARSWTLSALVDGYWSGDWGRLPGRITLYGDTRRGVVDLGDGSMLCLWVRNGRLTIAHSDEVAPRPPDPDR